MGKRAYFSETAYFDLGSKLFYNNQNIVTLSGAQRHILALLIENANQSLSIDYITNNCGVAVSRNIATEISEIRKVLKKIVGDETGRNYIIHHKSNGNNNNGSYSLNTVNAFFPMQIKDDTPELTDNASFIENDFDALTIELFYERDELKSEINDLIAKMTMMPNTITDNITNDYLTKSQELAKLNARINSNKQIYLQLISQKRKTLTPIDSIYSSSIQKAEKFYKVPDIDSAISELSSDFWEYHQFSSFAPKHDYELYVIRNTMLIKYNLIRIIKDSNINIHSIINDIIALYEEIVDLSVQCHNFYDIVLEYALFLFRFKLLEESIIVFDKLEKLYSLDKKTTAYQWGVLEYNWANSYSIFQKTSYNCLEAISHFKKSINHLLDLTNDDSIILLVKAYIGIATVLFYEKKYKNSVFYAQQAFFVMNRFDSLKASNLNILANIYSVLGKSTHYFNIDKSIEYFKEACKFNEKYAEYIEKNTKDVNLLELEKLDIEDNISKTYTNLYFRYKNKFEYDTARDYLDKSYKIKKKLYQLNPYEYGLSFGLLCRNMAAFYLVSQDFKNTRQMISESLDAKKLSLSGDLSKQQKTINSSNMLLAISYTIEGRYEEAFKIYNDILVIRKKSIDTLEQKMDLFSIMYNMGFSYLLNKDYVLAQNFLNEAINIVSDNIFAYHDIFLVKYCYALLTLARIHKFSKNDSDADNLYCDIYALCSILEDKSSFSRSFSKYIRAVAYYEIGVSLSDKNSTNPYEILNKSLELWTELLNSNCYWFNNEWLQTADKIIKYINDTTEKDTIRKKIRTLKETSHYLTHDSFFFII